MGGQDYRPSSIPNGLEMRGQLRAQAGLAPNRLDRRAERMATRHGPTKTRWKRAIANPEQTHRLSHCARFQRTCYFPANCFSPRLTLLDLKDIGVTQLQYLECSRPVRIAAT